MTTVTIEEAQANLSEIIQQLQPGEEVTIIDHGKPLAQMKKTERTLWSSQPQTAASTRPGPGLCQGVIVYMAPDFDAPLEDALLFLYQKVLQVQLPWLNDGWVKRSRLGGWGQIAKTDSRFLITRSAICPQPECVRTS